ncbi:hypothetical protein [Polyangium sp. y55x31]|uniref:CIS tube protein n=1 Tax=Polyangium sp. y55x31 TaxID=3042688 RepID=UPI002482573F|nr:hypothetical protein [Polyangium sp. y55x31]MDI1478923.1 hypothetical protein [Polyangium sp. y55x31]
MDRGALEKLRIEAHKQPACTDAAVATFEAYVNPSEITLSYELEYDSAQGAGTTGSRMEFKRIKPGDLTLSFFLDGTGASGKPLDVQKKIAEFQRVTEYNGDIHRPNYLRVAWGKLTVKRCVLKSASIAYKMFKPDGTPMRAVITATFTDSVDDQTRVAMANDKSSDLTHTRVVKAGDTLPGLCTEVYGDPRHYIHVAAANRLDDFRCLVPGTRLVFPPLEK